MITMQNIADEVGVSQTTVSFVLNNQLAAIRISKKTRQRIKETASKMGYYRNEIARSMVTGKTNVIGFLCYETKAEYIGQILAGTIEEAEKNDYFLKIFSVASKEHFGQVLKRCFEQRLAGIICRSLTEDMLDLLHQQIVPYNIPIALVDSSFKHPWGIRVISDDEKGAYLAVEHLFNLGHTRIAHISTNPTAGYADARRRGYIEALNSFNLKIPEHYLAFGKNMWDEQECKLITSEIESLTLELLQKDRKDRPTAIFCGSDPVAMVALRTIRNMGLKVPEDISVVGFANMLMSKLADPPLTTINQLFTTMGSRVTKLLIKEIEAEEKTSFLKQTEEKIGVELIIRQSTGPTRR